MTGQTKTAKRIHGMSGIYGDQYGRLEETLEKLLAAIDGIRDEMNAETGMDP